MDDIVLTCARRFLKNNSNINYVEKEVVQKTYSFEYSKFRFMMVRVVGIIRVEKLENSFDQAIFHVMNAALNTLKEKRNRAAHTYTSGATLIVDTPSTIKGDFNVVYDGLKDIERCVGRIRA